MTPDDKDRLYAEHMLECIARVRAYTQDGKAVFLASTLIQDAVLRNLQIMAESSQRLSETLKTAFPHINWRGMSGFRNVVVHDYLGVDAELIWAVVEQELPALENALQAMLGQ